MSLSENDVMGFSNTTGLPETEASSPMPVEVGSQVRVERCFVFFLKVNDKAPP